MNILHFILGKANKERANGVNQVIAGLAKYCSKLDADVKVIGKAQTVKHEGEIVQNDGFAVQAFSKWSSELKGALEEAIVWADIVHLHGVFSPYNILVSRMCDRYDVPYVVSPHGGLSPAAIQGRHTFRKQIFHALIQKKHLENAAALHATVMEDSTYFYDELAPKNVFCLPIGIDLVDFPNTAGKANKTESDPIRIGFLGRLAREKNIPALCKAFAGLNTDVPLTLVLAGPINSDANALMEEYSNVDVEFVGPKFGAEKKQFLEGLDLYILPSLTDALPIGSIEALAQEIPLIITRTSNISYFCKYDCFFMCEPSTFGLTNGIEQALNERARWGEMTERGRRLVEEQLNWEAISLKLLSQYELLKVNTK